MPRDSLAADFERYVGLTARWAQSHPTAFSAELVHSDPQLCNDILVDDIDLLKSMLEVAESTVKHVRYYKLAIRQNEGYSEEVEQSWREDAVHSPPLSDALWDFMAGSITLAGYHSDKWEELLWIDSEAPAWIADLARAAIGKCWTPFCFMRCRPNEARNVMKHHGIWSHGNELYVIDDESDAPFYQRLQEEDPLNQW